MTATQIMLDAHEGQKHGNGPYYLHPRAVAQMLLDLPGFFDLSQREQYICYEAALLHDVLEDSEWTATDLLDAGIDPHVVNTVVILTRTDDVDDDTYYARIRAHNQAIWVKTADMCHNLSTIVHLSPARKVKLTTKYAKGMAALHG